MELSEMQRLKQLEERTGDDKPSNKGTEVAGLERTQTGRDLVCHTGALSWSGLYTVPSWRALWCLSLSPTVRLSDKSLSVKGGCRRLGTPIFAAFAGSITSDFSISIGRIISFGRT